MSRLARAFLTAFAARALAYPSRGNCFIAFQPDETGAGGAGVLADMTDAHVVAVLVPSADNFTSGFFSDSGDKVAYVANRNDVRMIRSLRAGRSSGCAECGHPGHHEHPAPGTCQYCRHNSRPGRYGPVAVLSAQDLPGLQSHMGDLVTVQGLRPQCEAGHFRQRRQYLFHRRWNAARPGLGAVGPFPQIPARFGKDLNTALENRTIKATGYLSIYRGSIELTLDDPGQS